MPAALASHPALRLDSWDPWRSQHALLELLAGFLGVRLRLRAFSRSTVMSRVLRSQYGLGDQEALDNVSLQQAYMRRHFMTWPMFEVFVQAPASQIIL